MAKKSKAAANPVVSASQTASSIFLGLPFTVEIDKLGLDAVNARKGHKPDPELEASIRAHGLLHPLFVVPHEPTKDAKHLWSIVAGGRRYVTIREGIEKGRLTMPEIAVRQVQDGVSAKEISMAENIHQNMHPMDYAESILELAKTAEEEHTIAEHFNLTVKDVQKYAALGQLTDPVRECYRKGFIGYKEAALLTRLPEKDQNSIAKTCMKNKGINAWSIQQVIDKAGVDASLALFDIKDYPVEKIQKSLFDDVNLLLDRDLFGEMQDAALQKRIQAYKDAGYSDVIVVPKNDGYLIANKYSKVPAEKAKDKSKLVVLVRSTHVPFEIKFDEDMILTKTAKQLEKGKKGKTGTAEPVALTAKDFSAKQVRILAGMAMNSLSQLVESGKAPETLTQYLVVTQMLDDDAMWVPGNGVGSEFNGVVKAWNDLKKLAAEDFKKRPEKPLGVKPGLTYGAWLKMPKKDRDELYAHAVASMIIPTITTEFGDLKALVKDLPLKLEQWCNPGVDFLNGYRSDQLDDFFKKSKVDVANGKGPIDNKKTTKIAVARGIVGEGKFWRFGLE